MLLLHRILLLLLPPPLLLLLHRQLRQPQQLLLLLDQQLIRQLVKGEVPLSELLVFVCDHVGHKLAQDLGSESSTICIVAEQIWEEAWLQADELGSSVLRHANCQQVLEGAEVGDNEVEEVQR